MSVIIGFNIPHFKCEMKLSVILLLQQQTCYVTVLSNGKSL